MPRHSQRTHTGKIKTRQARRAHHHSRAQRPNWHKRLRRLDAFLAQVLPDIVFQPNPLLEHCIIPEKAVKGIDFIKPLPRRPDAKP